MVKKYFGTFHRSLDPKGRLLIPSRFGFEKGQDVYVVRGHEGCLAVYDEEGFDRLMEKYLAMDFENPSERAKVRIMASSTLPTTIDGVGRILLGKDVIRDYGIGGDVAILGVLDHFEIWDEGAYARYMLENGFAYDAPSKGKAA